MALTGSPADWRADTKLAVVRDALDETLSLSHTPKECAACDGVWRDLVPQLGAEPLIFKTKNGDGSMHELPRGRERSRRLRALVYEVHAHMLEAPLTAPEPPAVIAAPKPAPKPQTGVSAAHERFWREISRIREAAAARNLECLDSMRIDIDGAKAINEGVPVEALLAAIGATWGADTRRQLGVPEFDYAGFAPRPSRFSHAVSEYVARLVAADVPVWLHGPAGTGKSSAAKHAAATAGLDYYEVNLAGAMASAVKGKDRLKEFIESEFTRAYEHGGVICLEEFDAAHPTVATAINNAIAGDEFHNDADGRCIARHPNFRVIVTANTLGTGATKEFNSRMKLDGATLDRFRMGRVFVGRDATLARAIFEAVAA
jgi:hypothetical protein